MEIPDGATICPYCREQQGGLAALVKLVAAVFGMIAAYYFIKAALNLMDLADSFSNAFGK